MDLISGYFLKKFNIHIFTPLYTINSHSSVYFNLFAIKNIFIENKFSIKSNIFGSLHNLFESVYKQFNLFIH